MTTYTTPVTPTDFANLIALITWPQDCNQHKAAMDRCLDVISALKRGWAAMQPVRLYVGSDTLPGLADWQAAWVDLGYTLPITGNVIGIWETLTNAIKDGGQYVWLENDMRPTLAKWWNGSSEFILTTPANYTNTSALPSTETALITQSLTLDRAAYVESEWAAILPIGVGSLTGDHCWRAHDDPVNTIRYFLPLTNENSFPTIFRRLSAAKISAGSFSQYFRRFGAITNSPIFFTNNAVTRKLETGYIGQGLGTVLGEISALATEAIYLA